MGKKKEAALAEFVNDYVFNYLQREPEFIDVVEAADEDGLPFSEEELSKVHKAIVLMLREIADEAFGG